MSQLVDRLVELTTFRDRDLLDATLVTTLRELLQPRLVAIHRCVGEAADRRWLMRARLGPHDAAVASDPVWTELDQLPALAAFQTRCQVLRLQQPLAVPGSPALAVFPLASDREPGGVLEIETDLPLDIATHRLVTAILRLYGNFQALLDDNERDTLTGLLNRKTFEEAFYRLSIDRADEGLAGLVPGLSVEGERRHPLAGLAHYVGMIDIDHFKSVNDTHGHLIGDEVLLLLSQLMRSVFRFHDRLYRFGGEEFVVLMRCVGDGDAGAAFERLRSDVEAHVFPRVGRITVSVGYTRLRPGDTPSTAFDRADRAVYAAKRRGRNQVCSHAELVARGELVEGAATGDVELF
jgi:diguanylate cyclase (GGDEF)-like protein